ncbi:MAG: tyrosine-protein phosphatase [Dehalococcoidales bacterium]|nr:tyrosine-protein phosphatase [Dehalococcoidales bacterium]
MKQFEGLANFRDIGGLATADGRHMKANVLFRSDDLSQLSRPDLRKMEQLNLRLICDLRTPTERRARPDRIPAGNVRVVNVPIYQSEVGFLRPRILGFLLRRSSESDFEEFVRDYYQTIAFQQTAQIREVITLISEETNLPALIHCTIGRDRTGLIAALVQLLVGVPRSVVIDDYLISNNYYEARIAALANRARWLRLLGVTPERVREMLEARAEYLAETLDHIIALYDSVEEYLNKACSINRRRLRNLRQLLVE